MHVGLAWRVHHVPLEMHLLAICRPHITLHWLSVSGEGENNCFGSTGCSGSQLGKRNITADGMKLLPMIHDVPASPLRYYCLCRSQSSMLFWPSWSHRICHPSQRRSSSMRGYVGAMEATRADPKGMRIVIQSRLIQGPWQCKPVNCV